MSGAERCPDCGFPKVSHLSWINDYDGTCAAHTRASDAKLYCYERTMMALRSQLAAAEARLAAQPPARVAGYAQALHDIEPMLERNGRNAAALDVARGLLKAESDAIHDAHGQRHCALECKLGRCEAVREGIACLAAKPPAREGADEARNAAIRWREGQE